MGVIMMTKTLFRVTMTAVITGHANILAEDEDEVYKLAEEMCPDEFMTAGDFDIDNTEFDAEEIEK